jgi:hypothetical protein
MSVLVLDNEETQGMPYYFAKGFVVAKPQNLF